MKLTVWLLTLYALLIFIFIFSCLSCCFGKTKGVAALPNYNDKSLFDETLALYPYYTEHKNYLQQNWQKHTLTLHWAQTSSPVQSLVKFTIKQQYVVNSYTNTYTNTNLSENDCTSCADKLSTPIPMKTHKYCKTNKYTNKILQVNNGQTKVQSAKTKIRLHSSKSYQFSTRFLTHTA